MQKIYKYSIQILLVILIISNLLVLFSGSDRITEKEQELNIKIYDLQRKNKENKEKIYKYELNIKIFKNEILKNDSIIDNSSINELDSMFSDYFKR